MKKKKIAIVIDHDIIFRNFIFNNAFKSLSKKNEIIYVFPEVNNKRLNINVKNYLPKEKIYRVNEDTRRKLYWRYLMYIEQCGYFVNNDLKTLRKFRFLSLGWKASMVFKILSFPFIDIIFKTLLLTFLRTKKYNNLEKVFKHQQTEIIIHPTVLDGIFCNDLILIGRRLTIKTIFVMNSWDNPSTKNALIYNPNYLFVWGDQTKKHAEKFLKMRKNVIKFGANQFDGIKKIKIKYLRKNQFNKIKNNIMFAGSNAKVDEFKCLQKLNKLCQDFDIKLNFIYRPHPWSGGGHNGYRFNNTKWNNIKIDVSSRAYLKQIKKKNVPMSFPNQNDTYNLLGSVNITISPLSTIILETMMSGRLAFAYIPNDKNSYYINKILKNLIHFREILDSGALPILTSPEEIMILCNKYQEFENYKSLLKRQQAILPSIINTYKYNWSFRFEKFINNL